MQSGLVGFKQLLQEFKGVSGWAVGTSIAAPFAAALAALSPPWPPSIVLVTAIAELIALIYVYQFLKPAKRKTIERVLIGSGLVLAACGTAYLMTVSLYTYQVPTTKERFVKGYQCTPEAAAVFKDKCPDLGLDELKTDEYEAERLWTTRSIAASRIVIIGLWLSSFVALSVLVGSFLVYQMSQSAPKIRRERSRSGTG